MIPKNAANNATKKSIFFIIVLGFANYTPSIRFGCKMARFLQKSRVFLAICLDNFYNFGYSNQLLNPDVKNEVLVVNRCV